MGGIGIAEFVGDFRHRQASGSQERTRLCDEHAALDFLESLFGLGEPALERPRGHSQSAAYVFDGRTPIQQAEFDHALDAGHDIVGIGNAVASGAVYRSRGPRIFRAQSRRGENQRRLFAMGNLAAQQVLDLRARRQSAGKLGAQGAHPAPKKWRIRSIM